MLWLGGGVRGGRGSRRGGVAQHVVAGASALLHGYAELTAREHTVSAGATGQNTGIIHIFLLGLCQLLVA